jgi:hypothetical protein
VQGWTPVGNIWQYLLKEPKRTLNGIGRIVEKTTKSWYGKSEANNLSAFSTEL